MGVRVVVGHVLDKLRELPDSSVQSCITSPPYWGLRAYGTEPQVWDGDPACSHVWGAELTNPPASGTRAARDVEAQTLRQGAFCDSCGAWRGELGLEPTPELYVEHLVQVFREVRRVLRKDGTLWLNLGDSMAAAGVGGLKPKDLVGIPWKVAFALRDDGWYLRSDIVWAKSVSGQKELQQQLRTAMKKAGLSPDQTHRTLAHMEPYIGTCMPESVRDRPTRSHEYLFLLTKSATAYCVMGEIREALASYSQDALRKATGAPRRGDNDNFNKQRRHVTGVPTPATRGDRAALVNPAGRNRRSVWQITPKPYKGAHFATFPPELIEPCILAGTSPQGQCPECGAPWTPTYRRAGKASPAVLRAMGADAQGEYHGVAQKEYAAGLAQDPSAVKARTLAGVGPLDVTWKASCPHGHDPVPQTVLDPFGGSGTVGEVAILHARNAILIDLNPNYALLMEQRLAAARRRKGHDARPI